MTAETAGTDENCAGLERTTQTPGVFVIARLAEENVEM